MWSRRRAGKTRAASGVIPELLIPIPQPRGPCGPSPRYPKPSPALTPRLPGSVHGDFDGSVVGGHLRGVGEHGDGQGEAFPWRGKEKKTTKPQEE